METTSLLSPHSLLGRSSERLGQDRVLSRAGTGCSPDLVGSPATASFFPAGLPRACCMPLPWPQSRQLVSGSGNKVGTPACSCGPSSQGPRVRPIQTRHSDRQWHKRTRQTQERTGTTETRDRHRRGPWACSRHDVVPGAPHRAQVKHAPSKAHRKCDPTQCQHQGKVVSTATRGSPTADKKLTEPAWRELESKKGGWEEEEVQGSP